MEGCSCVPEKGAFTVTSVSTGASVGVGDSCAYGVTVDDGSDDTSVDDVVWHRGVMGFGDESTDGDIAFPSGFDV